PGHGGDAGRRHQVRHRRVGGRVHRAGPPVPCRCPRRGAAPQRGRGGADPGTAVPRAGHQRRPATPAGALMDLATLIGIGMAFAGIFGAQVMEGGNPASIILPAPLILVVLGTLGAAMASGVLKDSTGMVNQMKRAFTSNTPTSGERVDAVVAL